MSKVPSLFSGSHLKKKSPHLLFQIYHPHMHYFAFYFTLFCSFRHKKHKKRKHEDSGDVHTADRTEANADKAEHGKDRVIMPDDIHCRVIW